MRHWKDILGLIGFGLFVTMIVLVINTGTAQKESYELQANDIPLLTEEQKQEAIATDKVAFDCAGVHYVIESDTSVILDGYL